MKGRRKEEDHQGVSSSSFHFIIIYLFTAHNESESESELYQIFSLDDIWRSSYLLMKLHPMT